MRYGGKKCWVELFPFSLIWLCVQPASQGREEPNSLADGQSERYEGGRCHQGHQAAGGGRVPDVDGGGPGSGKAGEEER